MICTSLTLIVCLLHHSMSCTGLPADSASATLSDVSARWIASGIEAYSVSTALADAKARWAASGIRTYELDREIRCFCYDGGDTIRCTVVNDRVVSVINLRTHEAVDTNLHAPATVQDFFDIIERARSRRAAKLKVSYDPTYGCPTEIDIDWMLNTIDDEVTYMVIAIRTCR